MHKRMSSILILSTDLRMLVRLISRVLWQVIFLQVLQGVKSSTPNFSDACKRGV
jgi:hypothetical protein